MSIQTSGARPRLLVVDDEESIFPVIERLARRLGFDVEYRNSGRVALAALETLNPDVVLVDLRLPELTGIDVLKAVRAAEPDCQVILMTGNATVDTAMEAVRAGALDYLSKPFDFDRLETLLTGVRDARKRREQLLRADADVAERLHFHGMVGRSAEMQQIFATVRRLAPHVRTVLVSGETGTGKELVAKALHRESRRRDRRLVTVNCSAVVETLFESELFGHVRGAFTGATDTKVGLFEHADGGTLFLDEAGELPLALQPKLLRAVEHGEISRVGSLETRRVDVTVIAATNRDLVAESAAGRFRSDLYYRLSVLEIRLPPLRERREDIPYLTAAFVTEFAKRLGRPITGMTAGAERLLHGAPWPGNIRELRNVIERACVLSHGSMLTEHDMVVSMSTPGIAPVAGATPVSTTAAVPPAPAVAATAVEQNPESLSATQREQIRRVLREARGNKVEAAKRLGISRRSLYRWIERLGLGVGAVLMHVL